VEATRAGMMLQDVYIANNYHEVAVNHSLDYVKTQSDFQ
jgi:hypothetical protein